MLIHATCIAIDGRGVLLTGASGAGKSDLALRLIEGGAVLVADDQVMLTAEEGRLTARAPDALAGLLEVRGVGILRLPHVAHAPVALCIELGDEDERLPALQHVFLLDHAVRRLRLSPFFPSTQAKIRAALAYPSQP